MLSVTTQDAIAIVSLQKEPVNSLNLDAWVALSETLDKLEKDPGVRCLIIQSTVQRPVFTTGNDIMELYAPNTSKERYGKFWTISNKFLARLLVSPLLTICAIKGASPAVMCIHLGWLWYRHVL